MNIYLKTDEIKDTNRVAITNLPEIFEENDADDASFNKTNSVKDLEAEEIIEDQPITLKLLFKSITKMPKELVMLLVCQYCGWLAFFSNEIFFTDFVGQVCECFCFKL